MHHQLTEVEHNIAAWTEESLQVQITQQVAVAHHTELESLIDHLCGDLLEVSIHAFVAPHGKVKGLMASLKASHSEVQAFKADFEQ